MHDTSAPWTMGWRRLRTVATLCVTLTCCFADRSAAADLKWSHDSRGRPFVALSGEIMEGDAARIVLAMTHSRDGRAPYLLVDSPGGPRGRGCAWRT